MVSQRGFTFIAILLAVALVGAVLAAAATVWHTAAKRAREEELLFVGDQFRRAVLSYARSRAGGVAGQLPRSLDDLLRDPRAPAVTRHLRRIYVDPVTGKAEWGLVRNPEGGILGVYSLSEGKPLKTGNFRPEDQAFADKRSYGEWRFVVSEETLRKAALPVAGAAPAAPTPLRAPAPPAPRPGFPGQPPAPAQGAAADPSPFAPSPFAPSPFGPSPFGQPTGPAGQPGAPAAPRPAPPPVAPAEEASPAAEPAPPPADEAPAAEPAEAEPAPESAAAEPPAAATEEGVAVVRPAEDQAAEPPAGR